MSEKLYAWLLRLYPAHFREDYGEEALRLFRDRARDERGFFPRLRLWLDLFFDFTISLPRECFQVPAPRVAPLVPRRVYGFPALFVLEDASPRPSALAIGGLLSLVTLTTCWASLYGVHGREITSASRFAGVPNNYQSDHNEPRSTAPSAAAPDVSRATTRPGALDSPQRKHIVDSAIANLKEHYFDHDAAQKMADALAMHEKRGDYDAVPDPAAFAALVTQHIREVNPDRHLSFDYFQEPLPPQPTAQAEQVSPQYREAMKQQNCTFEKVELLSHNIGYLKLNSFPDPEVCRVAAMAAMTYVNHADVIIFDLRDNRGGSPEMVQLFGAYLFDHPEYWYNPRENTTEQSWTRSPVPGSELADKPVFVLTSARTTSGAEQFSYDLKMLKRATLVGETTAGAAHSGTFHRLDDHFGIGIPEVKAINPYSPNDWSEVGVEPDVKVPAPAALDVALKLARARTTKK
jgi:peptidase S41-like protein